MTTERAIILKPTIRIRLDFVVATIISILVGCAILMPGCRASRPPSDHKTDLKTLPEGAKASKDIGDGLKVSSKTIAEQSAEIEQESAAKAAWADQDWMHSLAKFILDRTTTIKAEAQNVATRAAEVDPGLRDKFERGQNELKASVARGNEWQAFAEGETKRADGAEKALADSQSTLVLILSIAAAVLILGGVALAVFAGRFGISMGWGVGLVVAGLVVGTLAYILQHFIHWLVLGVFGVGVAVAAFFAYRWLKDHGYLSRLENRTIPKLLQTTETARSGLTDEMDARLFGDPAIPGDVGIVGTSIQDHETTELVRRLLGKPRNRVVLAPAGPSVLKPL